MKLKWKCKVRKVCVNSSNKWVNFIILRKFCKEMRCFLEKITQLEKIGCQDLFLCLKSILRDVFIWSIVIQNECVLRFYRTIHGLMYISTSRSTLSKLAWSSFVLAGFGHCRLFDLQLLHGNARITYFHLHFHPLNLIPCQSCKKASLDCTIIGTLKIFCSNLHIFSKCSQNVR